MSSTSGAVVNPPLKTGGSYVEWASIFGGVVVAVAAALVFVLFGATVGLGIIAPWGGEGPGAATVSILGAAWFLITSAIAYYFGGYVAGRTRSTHADAAVGEVEMRDALHGAAVWGVGVLVFFWLGASVLSSIATGTAAVGSAAVQAGGAVVQSEAVGDVADYTVNKLYRSDSPATGPRAEDFRQQALQILGRAVADGELTAEDRDYLATLVATQTSLTPEEAQARVDEVYADAQAAAAQAAETATEAAEAAQNATLLLGFLTATGFLISLVAAWFGAVMGGSHRDSNTVSWIFVRTR